MKNIFKSFSNFIKTHKIWSVIIVLILIVVVWFIFRNSLENTKYTETPVVLGSLSEIVSVTGNVKPLADVDLAFERGGKVAYINVVIGEKVYAGENLLSISRADLIASLDRAKADLKISEVQLGQTQELTVVNSKIDKAKLDLSQAIISLLDTVKDSYTKADDAVRNKIYSLFNDPVKYNARLIFTTDTFLQEDIEDGKDITSDNLDAWYRSLYKTSSNLDSETTYNTAKTNLLSIKSLLNKCAEAVNGLSANSSGYTQTQIDTWKLNISTARGSVDLAIATLVNSWNQYQIASLALQTAERDFTIQGLNVDQAKANVASAEAELAKSIIRSPINGVVTNIDIKLGEIVSANKNIISVISYGDYEVETFVPEADIAKIKIGNTASTTLDAYGSGVNFETTVMKIDPAATVIDGVPTYKVTLRFINQNEKIKSGMTANLDILTDYKDNVLVLPSRLIVTKDDGKYVSMVNPDDQSEFINKKIIAGLRGSDGNVEIVSGLNEGDRVVAPVIQ